MLNLREAVFAMITLLAEVNTNKDYSGTDWVRIIKKSFVFPVMDVKNHDSVFS